MVGLVEQMMTREVVESKVYHLLLNLDLGSSLKLVQVLDLYKRMMIIYPIS
jgi:hypothetical protein